MILYINVFITNQRADRRYHARKDFGDDNRLDVFKYTLASLSVIPWTNAFIYVQLDNEYENRKDELQTYTKELFNKNLVFYNYRNDNHKKWQKACSEILACEDDLIWCLSNDDHVFIDSSLNALNQSIEVIQNDTSEFKSFHFSHWMENIRWFAGKNAVRNSNVVSHQRNTTDGIQLINKNLLKSWWFSNDFGDNFIKRSDDIMTMLSKKGMHPQHSTCFMSLKEIVRHFDAYGHVQIPASICPPYRIPNGFFEHDIKINYGYERRLNWVNINPINKNYFATCETGTDYRWLLTDVPLFWKSRISETVIEEINQEDAIRGRNEAVFNMANTRPQFGDWLNEADANPPVDWLSHLFE
jgi:hypothetical protein